MIGGMRGDKGRSEKDIEHVVEPRNQHEIKVVKLNAKADGIEFARNTVSMIIKALEGGIE